MFNVKSFQCLNGNLLTREIPGSIINEFPRKNEIKHVLIIFLSHFEYLAGIVCVNTSLIPLKLGLNAEIHRFTYIFFTTIKKTFQTWKRTDIKA